jgi:DNA polymerase
MKGFFTPQETKSASRPDGKILSCISCGAYRTCNSPKQAVQGNGKKGILIIGAAPESTDDKRGVLFQSKSAKLLSDTLLKLKIDLFEDCFLTNALRCYLPTTEGNRKPTPYEIDCCRVHIMKAIKQIKPCLIILLGDSALMSVIGGRWNRDLGNIDKWRGFTIPDQELKAWVCPTLSHQYVESVKEKREEVVTIWEQDLHRAIEMRTTQFREYKEPHIEYLDSLDVLTTIKSGNIAFDYETTGLKPQADGHFIACVSIAYSENNVYVFMLPKTKKKRKPFTDLLINPNIGKIAQNMKYEDNWTSEILGVEVVNWVWDTMLATHILNNRSGVTSLKFQTYVQFGIIDYESEVSYYLKAKGEEGTNALNKIHELIAKPGGAKTLMKYCAYDSIYEFRLSVLQRNRIQIPF